MEKAGLRPLETLSIKTMVPKSIKILVENRIHSNWVIWGRFNKGTVHKDMGRVQEPVNEWPFLSLEIRGREKELELKKAAC